MGSDGLGSDAVAPYSPMTLADLAGQLADEPGLISPARHLRGGPDTMPSQHMLAMKVHAGRQRDADDIRWLTSHLEVSTVETALTICAAVFPDEPLPDRARLLLEDLLGAQ